jgi:uncharacterized membrane protein
MSMIRLSKPLALALLAFICLAYVVTPAMAGPSSTNIRVEVLSNGDSRWTTEKKIPLETPEDVASWDATAAQGTDRYKGEFDARMKDTVSQISAAIGRPMAVKDVNVTVEKAHPYAISDNGTMTYGIIRYDFTWTGFAMASGDLLEVGDAFVDGFLLNKDDAITFIFPPEYDVTGISPAPDDIKNAYQPQVRWMGSTVNGTGEDIRLFSSGEPSILMRKTSAPPISLEWWMLIPVILLSAVVGFGAGYFLLGRQPKPVEIPPVPDRMVMPDAGVEASLEPQEFGEDRYLSDEEKVVMYLEEAGGQMFQSDLVRKTDFSKSKLSMVLSDLKEKGTILKIKKGKENLIRLNRPSDNKPGEDKDQPA